MIKYIMYFQRQKYLQNFKVFFLNYMIFYKFNYIHFYLYKDRIHNKFVDYQCLSVRSTNGIRFIFLCETLYMTISKVIVKILIAPCFYLTKKLQHVLQCPVLIRQKRHLANLVSQYTKSNDNQQQFYFNFLRTVIKFGI